MEIFQLFGTVLFAAAACFMAAVATCIAGTLLLTNVFKMNYETAGRRNFISGASLAALALLCASGLSTSTAGGFLPAVILVAPTGALYALYALVAVVVIWGVLIFRAR